MSILLHVLLMRQIWFALMVLFILQHRVVPMDMVVGK